MNLLAIAIFVQGDIQNQKIDELRAEVNGCVNSN